MTKRLSLITIVTAIAALAALAFLLARPAPSGAADTASAAPVDPHGAFAVFGGPASAGDVMPAEVRKELAPITARENLDLDAARAVAPSGTGMVWAIPGDAGVCLAIPDPVDGFGINCADTRSAQQGELWVGLNGLPGQQVGDVRAAILVPDGVDSVTAVGQRGERRALAVSDNVAFADLSDSASLAYDQGGTTHSVNAPGTPAALVDGQG